MKLKVRRLVPSDIGGVAKLLKEFHKETQNEYPLMDNDEIERELLFILSTINNPQLLYLVAFDGKQMVGWFFGEMIQRYFGKPRVTGVARELYIVPKKRGRGVAKRLMSLAIRYAAESGAESLEEVGLAGTTQPRWEKLGFKSYLVNGWMDLQSAKKFVKELQ